jgi:hypothetical protein
MTDVACFCGCCYRFDGDSSACPNCGEPVSLERGSDEIAQQMRDELRLLLKGADPAELPPATRDPVGRTIVPTTQVATP